MAASVYHQGFIGSAIDTVGSNEEALAHSRWKLTDWHFFGLCI